MRKFNTYKLVYGKKMHKTKVKFYDFRNLGVLKYILFDKNVF